MKRASGMHIDNSSPTYLFRVVQFLLVGWKIFEPHDFFFACIMLGQCRSINFFKTTRNAWIFFKSFSLTRIFILNFVFDPLFPFLMVRPLVMLNATCYSAVGFKSTILNLCSFSHAYLLRKLITFIFLYFIIILQQRFREKRFSTGIQL